MADAAKKNFFFAGCTVEVPSARSMNERMGEAVIITNIQSELIGTRPDRECLLSYFARK